MRKFLLGLFYFVFIFSSSIISPVNALENDEITDYDKFAEFIRLSDEQNNDGVILEEIIIYDELLGIDNLGTLLNAYSHSRITPFGWELSGNVGTNELAALKWTFTNISWLYRTDGWTLSFTPRSNYYNLHSQSFGGKYYTRDSVWSVITILFMPDYQWNYKNGAVMKKQWVCHWDFARTIKTPWNIEPWRTSGGGPTKGCN